MADILVIEDEDNIAAALDFLLSRDGHNHDRMACGEGAVERIRRDRPDLVLLDVMLPDISGYQIVQDLRADPGLAGTRVLLMTARGSVVERRKGLALGADGFIAKPFELSELRAEIARLLERC
ncbi:response regulator [Paracoccus sp. 1_MG-2023]|uniref:response regulator transcription factor n=1 Tax=unclassified Paracoccus (in: a-proteobacteria) TaxID=2688777 RepID=UPI001C08BBE8|nr:MULTISPECIES: response regulator [unclassified Paracoccus (in: a-proteobacteria)]MBU2958656.1 response regulator [Paracoccus sp. C2R09]MDO6667649.1 response regulator [Paracoccus sp. 1_MG-2023]